MFEERHCQTNRRWNGTTNANQDNRSDEHLAVQHQPRITLGRTQLRSIFVRRMGRVARYKKVKAFDPFSKQNGGRVNLETVGIWGLGADPRKKKKHSKTAERLRAKRKKPTRETDVFDIPPESEDDFDLSDLHGSIKRQKVDPEAEYIGSATMVQSNARELQPKRMNEDSELETSRILKLEKQLLKEKPSVQSQGRMEGESKRAYQKRAKSETRQIIRQERMASRNPEKMKRKKEFLKNKKKKKRGKDNLVNDDDNENKIDTELDMEASDTFITGEQAIAARSAAAQEVKFGEQAERPPTFKHLPRGAERKTEIRKSFPGEKMDDDEIRAEQQEMERYKRKIHAQYALMKKQRKGDFHL